MGAQGHDGLVVPGRVVLAHEAPFSIGRLEVNPALREIRCGKSTQILEPRVMQVLVALARSKAAIVTRDELIATCWDSRIVSEDSINRVLSRIRHVAAGIGGGTFAVETITKVGYRLTTETGPEKGADEGPIGSGSPSLDRRLLFTGLGVALLGTGVWFAWPRQQAPVRLAKLYYERGLAARGQGLASFGEEQAVAYFREAVRIDPDYADAWGALAWGYRSLLEFEPRPDSAQVAKRARSAANRALELNADNADAQVTLVFLEPTYRRWGEVEDACRTILARHPDHHITRYNFGHVLTETGQWRAAIDHFKSVAAAEPFWPIVRINLFQALWGAGREDEAEEQILEAIKLWPRRVPVWRARIRQLLLTGRNREALAFLEDESVQPPDNDGIVQLERLIAQAHASGSTALRHKAVDGLLDSAQSGLLSAEAAAVEMAFLHEVDMAFSIFEGVFFGRGSWSAHASEQPPTRSLFLAVTAPLRSDPRFARLAEEIGLGPFWRERNILPEYRRQ